MFKYLVKNYLLSFFFVGISFFSFSQYKYSLEVESFNDKHPKEVLDDISQYIEDYNRHIKDGVFLFESKVLYTERDFNEISAATGYKITAFKVLSDGKEEEEEEEEDDLEK